MSASCDLRDQMENQLKKLEELLKETIRENKDIAQRLVHVEQQQTQTNKLVDNLQALQKTYQTQTRQAVADVAQKQTQTNKNIGYIRAQQETYQTQTNESIQNIKTEQEEYHRKTDEVIGDLRDKAGEALIPSEEGNGLCLCLFDT